MAFVNGQLSVNQVPTVTLTSIATLTKVSGGYQASITVTNSGTASATNVTLATATLGAVPGPNLPVSLGTLAPSGGSATVTVTFPSSVGSDGAIVVEKLGGTYTGGSFSTSVRAVLP